MFLGSPHGDAGTKQFIEVAVDEASKTFNYLKKLVGDSVSSLGGVLLRARPLCCACVGR